MNRRDLLKRLGAAGLVAATLDIPRFFALDQTMIPGPGTFRFYVGDRSSPPISYLASAEDVELAIAALMGAPKVTLHEGVYTIAWKP